MARFLRLRSVVIAAVAIAAEDPSAAEGLVSVNPWLFALEF